MNNITFGNGFHLDPYTMDYMMKTLREPIMALAKSSKDYIVAGMEVTAPVSSNITISEGFAVISGVLYHFAEQEGNTTTTGTKLKVESKTTQNTYKDGQTYDAYFTTELVVDNTEGTISLSDLLKNKYVVGIQPTDRWLSITLESGVTKAALSDDSAVICGFADVSDSTFQARLLSGEMIFEGVIRKSHFVKNEIIATLSFEPGKPMLMPATAYLISSSETESTVSTTVTPYYIPVMISATGELSLGRGTNAQYIAFHGSHVRI